MTHRRVRIGRAGGRFSGIFTAFTMHVIEPLGLGVIRLYVFVTNRPGRRESAVMLNLTEVFFAQTEQGSAVKFRIATDVVIRMRMELFAVLVVPHLFRLVLSFEVHGAGIPVIFFARNIAAAFKE